VNLLLTDLVRSDRSHSLNSQGIAVFNITEAGIDRQFIHSPLFRSPNDECQRLTGGAQCRGSEAFDDRLSWRPLHAARIAAAVTATAGLSLLAAGCGSGSPGSRVARLGSMTTPTRSGSSSTAAASRGKSDPVAFSHCMRTHGVLNFPDPNDSGAIPKVSLQQLGVSSSQFRTTRACRRLLPSRAQPSPAQIQQVINALSKFARCVRSHGVPNWPDPLAEYDPGQPGTPGFPREMPGVNENSPHVEGATGACQHLLVGIGYPSGGYP
jgi:hypothetical protein